MSYTQVSLPEELVSQVRDCLSKRGIATTSNADAIKYLMRREIDKPPQENEKEQKAEVSQ